MKYLSKTIEYGLYLLVFLLPWQTRWIIKPGLLNGGPWEYGTVSLYGTDIILIFVLLLFVVSYFLRRRIINYQLSIINEIQNSKFSARGGSLPTGQAGALGGKTQNYFVLSLLLCSIISIFFAPDKLLALYKFGWLLLGLGLFWLITRAEYDRIKLVGSLLLGLAAQAGLGIWQFLNQATFANKWLGLALHRAGELGTAVVETVGPDGLGERWLRAYGGLDHPNILGGVLAIGILILISEMIRAERVDNFQFSPAILRGSFQTIFNVKIFKIISWILLVVFAAALFFSFSRSAWLGLGVGLAVLLTWAVAKKDWLSQRVVLQVILVMGIVGFILFFQNPNLVMTRLYASERLEIKSASERLESIKNSWPLIKKYWASGAGAGNYTLVDYLVKARECGAEKKNCDKISSFIFQPVHNVFLLVWTETGILGLLCFFWVIVCLIIFNLPPQFCGAIFPPKADQPWAGKQFFRPRRIRLWRTIPKFSKFSAVIEKRGEAKNGIVNLSILVILIVLLSLDHWLWSLHFGALFFWLTLGLAARDAWRKSAF